MSEFGKYVVIEGHDGTGKSTQVGLVRNRLADDGIESIEFHEPEGAPIADEIRTIIKNGTLSRSPETNLLLFTAARREIWLQKAEQALKLGKWVVAARNYYSTLAYQGYGEGLDVELIEETTRTYTSEQYMQPDHSVILTLEDENERSIRIANRGELENPDTFESKDEGFQRRVQQGYLTIAQQYNLPTVSALQSKEAITNDIMKLIQH